jgi:hypothetical protein
MASEIFSYDFISFSVKKSFNIQQLLHCKSKQTPWNQADAPLPLGELSKETKNTI